MKKSTVIIFICIVCKIASAQSLELGVMAFPNLIYSSSIDEQTFFKPNLNGSGLKVQYQTHFKDFPFDNTIGLELSTVDWGSQILSRLGVQKQLAKEQFSIEILFLNGIALYVNEPAYIFGLESNLTYHISIKQKTRLKVSAGLRFSQNTKYKTVGLYRFVDIPLSVCWVIK